MKPSAPQTATPPLLGNIRQLIEASQTYLAITVNSAPTLLYRHIGQRIRSEVLQAKLHKATARSSARLDNPGEQTGIPKILKAMATNGLPAPLFETDDDRLAFVMRLPRHPLLLVPQADTLHVTAPITPC